MWKNNIEQHNNEHCKKNQTKTKQRGTRDLKNAGSEVHRHTFCSVRYDDNCWRAVSLNSKKFKHGG